VVPSRTTLIAAGGLTVFALVAALSSRWSLSAGDSINTGILSAGYLGALALGVLLGPALRRPGVVFATGLTALATIASTWALIARSFATTTGVQFTPRLSGSLSLPNALAVLALTGVIGGFALCAHSDRRLRALGGGVVGVNMLALVLTSSRSGLGLALVGIIALQLLLPAAPRMRLIGILAAIPALALGFRIATWPTFGDLTKAVSPAGLSLSAALVLAAALGALLAVIAVRVIPGAEPDGLSQRASRRTLLLALGSVLILMGAVVIKAGGLSGTIDAIRRGFTGPVGQSGVRVGLGSNLRDHWWSTALDGFRADPWHGWGAGTFRLLEQTTRAPAYTTGSAHNTVLEALAGTGLAGGIPFLIGGIALAAMAIAGIRHARPGDAVGALVVAVSGLAFVLQGLVDVDWSLAAQGVLVYAAIGAIAPAPNLQSRVTISGRAIAGGLCVGLVFAGLLGVPIWFSARDTSRSQALLFEQPQVALDAAASANRYNPYAVDPLMAEADALQALGDTTGAQHALLEAIALEPKNYEPWLAYGTYLAYSWGQLAEGRAALQQALKLSGDDPSVHVVIDTLPPVG